MESEKTAGLEEPGDRDKEWSLAFQEMADFPIANWKFPRCLRSSQRHKLLLA